MSVFKALTVEGGGSELGMSMLTDSTVFFVEGFPYLSVNILVLQVVGILAKSSPQTHILPTSGL